jgi:hypothetical protein
MTVLCIGLLSINVYAADTKSEAAPDEWEFVWEVYGWIATIDGTSGGGTDFEIDFETIVENLDFTFMSVLGARKERWTFMVDVVYLDIEDTPNTNLKRFLQLTSVEMQDWIVNPFVSYEVFGNKKGSFQVLAGVRYLDIAVDLEIGTRPPLRPRTTEESMSDNVWDGIVGIRGFYNLTDRWFVPYRLDVGTGDSDFTWHALAGIGYKFDTFKLIAGYRHMAWEFEDDSMLDDLQVSGLIVGAIFTF